MIENLTDTVEALPDFGAALMDSRQRWRAFSSIAADFAFETDAVGRLTFLSPEHLLGWVSADLLGQPGAVLLADAVGVGQPGSDPFRAAVPVQRRRTWLNMAAGGTACFAISSVPLLDTAGRIRGTRGVGVDVTAREEADTRAAAALRRGEVLDHILGQMRHEVLAPRMMETVLAALMRALGALGAAVLELPAGQRSEAPYAVGADPAPVLADADRLLRKDGLDLHEGRTATGLQLLTCPASTRFGEQAGLVVWRAGWARAWDEDDRTLAASGTGIIRIVLEHEAIQRHLARQARTDPLTGLLNRRAFIEETARRIDRLDREDLPGTMLCLDLDGFMALNARLGHDVGDAMLTRLADLLRRTFRPTDLLARMGGDEFALWLDGSDELTAAERAEGLRLAYPREVADLITSTKGLATVDPAATLSIGIACRQPGTHEELDPILHRAAQALRDAKRAGRGQWRVSQIRAI